STASNHFARPPAGRLGPGKCVPSRPLVPDRFRLPDLRKALSDHAAELRRRARVDALCSSARVECRLPAQNTAAHFGCSSVVEIGEAVMAQKPIAHTIAVLSLVFAGCGQEIAGDEQYQEVRSPLLLDGSLWPISWNGTHIVPVCWETGLASDNS